MFPELSATATNAICVTSRSVVKSMNDAVTTTNNSPVFESVGETRAHAEVARQLVSRARVGFEESLPFALDDFQVRAFDALDAGASVVVAAPTGSGKTLVAEYAIFRALHVGGKAFYTAPIKALSNQKFADLVARHGTDNVGLLTGDNAVNPDAPIVVMTTEVLRNMIYARSPALNGLRYVVLDEVHYLQDSYRGPVWEEVIIHTPMDVDLVCLSATVSNAEELAAWVTSVRGHTEAIIHEIRPTELQHIYLVGNRDSGEVTILPTFVDGRPNQQAMRLDAEAHGASTAPRNNRRRPIVTPRRIEIVDALRHEDMLPAIYFIFSRAACDEAVNSCLYAGLRLTLPEERRAITAIVEERVQGLTDDDLKVLDYKRFLTALQNGFAAHHAGMVPTFKEVVEACFVEGLVKVVFATETLALGINMPARSVVIEKLTKFGGERHQFLTPGEYTQLTGRAGRRGIDPIGYAATLWTPFVPFEQVASLAAKRTYELRSSFRPTNNMTVNLVRRYQPLEAHHLLSLSFAQYRIDSDLVSANLRLDRLKRELGEARTQAACEHGDIRAFVTTKTVVRGPVAPEREIAAAMEQLKPGDVLAPAGVKNPVRSSIKGNSNGDAEADLPYEASLGPDDGTGGSRPGEGWLLVLATARRRGRDSTLRATRPNGKVIALTPRDFRTVPNVVSTVRLPTPFNPNSRSFQDAATASLNKTIARFTGPPPGTKKRGSDDADSPSRPTRKGRPAPVGVEACPEFDLHVKAFHRAQQLQREIERVGAHIDERRDSLGAQFDRVLQLLEGLGYLDGWSVTPFGDMLAGIFHESDLLVAECLRGAVFDGLSPAQLAGLVSTFVYEQRGGGARRGRTGAATQDKSRTFAAKSRSKENRSRGGRRNGDLPDDFPSALTARWWAMNDIADDLNEDETALGLPMSKPLDPGFVGMAQRWAGGRDLDDVLGDSEVTGGDFVRTTKILIDLLRQIGKVAPVPETAKAARQASDALFRGVVQVSSVENVAFVEPVNLAQRDAVASNSSGSGVSDAVVSAAPASQLPNDD
jgi:ATP-dependent RNA helicase HelY